MKTHLKTLRLLPVVAAVSFQAAVAQDLNNDGELNGADCQVFLQRISSGSTAGSSDLDVNSDGVTDLKDALLFGQWVNGLWNNPSGAYTALYSTNPQDSVAFNNYQKNLKARKSAWKVDDLKKAYPDNTLKTDLSYDSSTVEFITEVGKLLPAAGYMDRVLEKGVAVYSATNYPNFYSAFDAIHTNDLPVIFTTDAMLQTIYRSYDNILMQLEISSFIPALEHILFSSLAYLNKIYGDPDYVKDARTYFETALKLLKPSRTDLSSNQEVTSLISAITAEQMKEVTLFGRTKKVDFSQFKPRGHYTKQEILKNYFKAIMWLGRSDLAFEIGGSSALDPSRMKRGALVVWDCVVNSGTLPQWLEFNRIIEYMVGTGDGLTVRGMGTLVHDLGDVDIPEFVGNFNEKLFDSVTAAGGYGLQTILSESRQYQGPVEKLNLSRIFNFMPQRFIIDSYAMSQLVYPLTERRMPSSLDIAFVLGDNTAIGEHTDLVSMVPGTLGSLRRLYDEISFAGWQSNMYTSWINFLRQLSGVENNLEVSPVFRTQTWAKKMRNTQLTSWAHLRHNTILYAKQSYTAEVTCSHPRAYVEPYPAFFRMVTLYAQKGAKLFMDYDSQISGFFKDVAEISMQLANAAELTAKGKELTSEQVTWLRSIVSSHYVGGDGYNPATKVYDGWYFDLVYDNDPKHKEDGWISFTSIADVHTKPADETGPALVLHAATGYINLMTVVVELDSCTSLFVGPTGSYYDVLTSADSPKRITDEAWETELQNKISGTASMAEIPSWAGSYMY